MPIPRHRLRFLFLAGLFVALVFSDSAQAQSIRKFDLNPGLAGSFPFDLTPFNGSLLFAADDGVHGAELWKGSGDTAALLSDIFPGGSPAPNSSSPAELTLFAGAVYFRAADGAHGAELWRTDGSPAGTRLFNDLNPGATSGQPNSSFPADLTVAGPRLFFDAAGPSGVRTLWATDGTSPSTHPIIPPGADPPTDPSLLAALNNRIVFRAIDNAHGEELWTSDGTDAGTQLLRDINPGPQDGRIRVLTAAAGRLFFRADDGVHGDELWATDGTASGTQMLADIAAAGGSSPAELAAFGSFLVFSADDGVHGRQLWRSDGSPSGTRLLATINPSGGADPSGFCALGGLLLFSAFNPASGRELWATNGLPGGTHLVRDINPGQDAGVPRDSSPSGFVAAGSLVYFSAADDANGRELWATDGSSAGTRLVADLFPGKPSSNPSGLAALGNELWLSAGDPAAGTELARVRPLSAAGDWLLYR